MLTPSRFSMLSGEAELHCLKSVSLRGAGPSPEPQNFLGHHSLVTESPVAICGDAASSAVPHASAASYHAEMGR